MCVARRKGNNVYLYRNKELVSWGRIFVYAAGASNSAQSAARAVHSTRRSSKIALVSRKWDFLDGAET